MSAAAVTWPFSALEEAGHVCGFSLAELTPFGMGHCACFAVPSMGLFVRVGHSGNEQQAVNAVAFAAACAPVVDGIISPADIGIPQPLRTPDGPVTFWPLLQKEEGDVDYTWLGTTLRELHAVRDIEGMKVVHRQTNPALKAARLRSLKAAPHVPDWVVAACDKMMSNIQELRERVMPALRSGLIHGDVYPANVARTVTGSFLVDYDTAGAGPIYWDLAPAMVSHRRFGTSAESLDRLYAAYGEDPRDDESFWDVVRIREWGAITYLIDQAAKSEIYCEELVTRLIGDRPWRSLDELRQHTSMGTETGR
ncbi:aminoglycoside phosphotransferase family protein [Streptomyces sp. NPDC005322]|uniref:aminoglycoside phosphotransferase family protein n=1 Tax=Streptomyces sp. NPDC005322 TaxID=3157032 RepID=UPI0033B3A884